MLATENLPYDSDHTTVDIAEAEQPNTCVICFTYIEEEVFPDPFMPYFSEEVHRHFETLHPSCLLHCLLTSSAPAPSCPLCRTQICSRCQHLLESGAPITTDKQHDPEQETKCLLAKIHPKLNDDFKHLLDEFVKKEQLLRPRIINPSPATATASTGMTQPQNRSSQPYGTESTESTQNNSCFREIMIRILDPKTLAYCLPLSCCGILVAGVAPVCIGRFLM